MTHPGAGPQTPQWLLSLAQSAAGAPPAELARMTPPAGLELRESAVLILFGPADQALPQHHPADAGPAAGTDLLLIERAAHMRSHAGQPAFPGGGLDPQDDGPVAAALREAQEETGVDPLGVQVLAQLPALWVPPSGYRVTPVLAWWAQPGPVAVMDPDEVARVERVRVADLVNPANRVRVAHPSGFVGPGFQVAGMLVWGFTGGLVDRLLAMAGLEQPWLPGRTVNL